MESRSAVLGFHTGSRWKYEKLEHENGLKMGPAPKSNILKLK